MAENAESLNLGNIKSARSHEAMAHDVSVFKAEATKFIQNKLGPDDFRKFRLQNGVYGQRQAGVQMIRVKLPWGGVTPEQLVALGEVAKGTPRSVGHITTRQNFQFHFVKIEEATVILDKLAKVGLTTREACGNTVRNITSGPHAGICPQEIFDSTPWAEALFHHFLRNPLCQNLPRKFKIAFSSCPHDDGLVQMHDIGALAATNTVNGKIVRGFKIYVGGGLAAAPRVAILLEDFTPLDRFVLTCEAIVRVFDKLGNRKDKHRARIKFLVETLGEEEFRKTVLEMRSAIEFQTIGRVTPPRPEAADPELPPRPGKTAPVTQDKEFERWKESNTFPQRQVGYHAVTVRFLLGDVASEQFKILADAAKKYCSGSIRSTVQQNFLLRWVPSEQLLELYKVLKPAGLALPSAERLADVTSCPGADTCQLGITSSRGLASAIGSEVEKLSSVDADLKDLHIKVSGCPNSCGQHHIASIGFFGAAKKVDGRMVPHFQMLLGGRTHEGTGTKYGIPVSRLPSKKIPKAVLKLISLYKKERQNNETFNAYVDRMGKDYFAKAVEEFTTVAPYAEAPQDYLDWGQEEAFVIQTGPGECAA